MLTKTVIDNLQVAMVVLATLFIQTGQQTDPVLMTMAIGILLLITVVMTAFFVRRLGVSLVETSDNLIHRLELEVQRKQGEIDAITARLDKRDSEARKLDELLTTYKNEAERLRRSLEVIAESVGDKDAYIIQLENRVKELSGSGDL